MPRLSEALGGRAELWIKREDLGPLAFSGNKLRNLEFLLGAALAEGADTVVTSGRRWSNHCRLTAAAGARLGLAVHIVVSGPAIEDSANLRLIRLLGATVHEATTDDRAERESILAAVVRSAERAGRRVRVLPVGGSEAVGAWGQLLAALEAIDQARSFGAGLDAIVLPSATGGTQAGLIAGAAVAAADEPRPAAQTRVLGIAVLPDPELRAKVARLAGELAAMARIDAPAAATLDIDARYIGPGYSQSTDALTEATELLARSEGILVDPVYTAKGLAGLIGHVRAGSFDGRRVAFWHGGGLPALFEPALGR